MESDEAETLSPAQLQPDSPVFPVRIQNTAERTQSHSRHEHPLPVLREREPTRRGKEVRRAMAENEYADWTVAPNQQDELAFLFGVDVEEETDSRLRLLVTYIESPPAIERKEFKQLEFWMFKEDGAKLASVLTRLPAHLL
jgi:hypothetical protein